jgi:hypothetical protein
METKKGTAVIPSRNLLAIAKGRGIPEDDPLLVRTLEAWNKGRRGEITLEEMDSIIMKFLESGRRD